MNNLKIKHVTFVGLLILSTNIYAKVKLTPSRYNCQGVNNQIETIKERQRKGTTSKQSDKLRDKLRLMKSLKRDCKKKKFSTK
jgi:hypothetical protein